MSVFGLKDTAAFKVVDQMVSHMWSGIEWEERDLAAVYRLFVLRNGSWKDIMDGSPAAFQALETAISDYINYRDIMKAAKNICVD